MSYFTFFSLCTLFCFLFALSLFLLCLSFTSFALFLYFRCLHSAFPLSVFCLSCAGSLIFLCLSFFFALPLPCLCFSYVFLLPFAMLFNSLAFSLSLPFLCLSLFFLHRKKKVRKFLVPSRDVTTKLSLGGNNDVITELFLPRGSLVSDIPAGYGKLVNLFLRCTFIFTSYVIYLFFLCLYFAVPSSFLHLPRFPLIFCLFFPLSSLSIAFLPLSYPFPLSFLCLSSMSHTVS